MHDTTRRGFLKKSALIGIPTLVPAAVLGRNGKVPPSERVNVGLIGCGSITRAIENRYFRIPTAQLLAVCDPFEHKRIDKKKLVDAGYAKQRDLPGYNGCLAYNDFRELLANKDIDAVQISTGDYWHVPISILAAKAGKDLHTEKPLGLCIHECLQMERAVYQYGRIFQYGTEGRSMAGTRIGVELVLNGHIGEVQRVYAWAPHGYDGGDFTPAPVPAGFDYDLWLGPAPAVPYSPGRCSVAGSRNAIFHHYDYAIGFIAGWGAHPVDIYQWWADHSNLGIPREVEGTGTIPKDGVYNTITHWNVTWRYDHGPVVRFFDTATAQHELPKIAEIEGYDPKSDHGVIFIGTKGQIHVSRGNFHTSPAELRQLGKNPGPVKLRASKDHEGDWIDAILNRQAPVSEIRSAVRSDIICHLGDIAIRTGRKIIWDDDRKTIVNDPTAQAMMFRKYRAPWSVEL
jgi:predicted dehydrogenase